MAATRTLDLRLPERHPSEGCQNLRGLPVPRLPDKMFVVVISPTGEGLLSPSHQKHSISNRAFCRKSAKLRKKRRKGRQDGRHPHVRQAQTKLTRKIDSEIFFPWGHFHNAPSWLVNVSRGYSNHVQKGVFILRACFRPQYCYANNNFSNP